MLGLLQFLDGGGCGRRKTPTLPESGLRKNDSYLGRLLSCVRVEKVLLLHKVVQARH